MGHTSVKLAACLCAHQKWRLGAQCGLHRGSRAGLADLEEQAEVMAAQLRLAKELRRPVSVRASTLYTYVHLHLR